MTTGSCGCAGQRRAATPQEPHRGRITEAEKSYVREHLDEVNKRLRGNDMRTIDASDPSMRERYGLLEQIRS